MLRQHAHVICWVVGNDRGCIGVLRTVAMERGLYADPQATAQRSLLAQLLSGLVDIGGQRLAKPIDCVDALTKHLA